MQNVVIRRVASFDAAQVAAYAAPILSEWERINGHRASSVVIREIVESIAASIETVRPETVTFASIVARAMGSFLRTDSPVAPGYSYPASSHKPSVPYTGPTIPKIEWSDAVVKGSIVQAMQSGAEYFDMRRFSGGRYAVPVGVKREPGQDHYGDALVETWYGGCDTHPNRSAESAQSPRNSTAPLIIGGQSIARDNAWSNDNAPKSYTVASELQAIADGTYVGFVGDGRESVRSGDVREDGYRFASLPVSDPTKLPRGTHAGLVQNGEVARNRAEAPEGSSRLQTCRVCSPTLRNGHRGARRGWVEVTRDGRTVREDCRRCATHDRGLDTNADAASIRRMTSSRGQTDIAYAAASRIMRQRMAMHRADIAHAGMPTAASMVAPLGQRDMANPRNVARAKAAGTPIPAVKATRGGGIASDVTTAATLRPVVSITDARRANDEARADAAAWAATDAMKRNGCGWGIHADDK